MPLRAGDAGVWYWCAPLSGSPTTRGAGYQRSAPAWGSAVGIHGSGGRATAHTVHEERRLAHRAKKQEPFHAGSLGMRNVRWADSDATRCDDEPHAAAV